MHDLLTWFYPLLLDLTRVGIWFVAVCVIFIPLERIFAARKQKVLRKQLGNDCAYFVMSWILPPVLMAPVLALVYWVSRGLIPEAFFAAVAAIPFWQRAILALILGDVGYYWGHRALHTVPLLWRFHSVHHSAEELDFLIDLRMHPVDMLFGRLSGLIPVYALGLGAPTGVGSLVPALIAITGTLWGFFIHANLRFRYGPVEWLFGTPPFHRWHHALRPANQNYAALWPWIDMIFGTYYAPKGESPAAYGIDSVMPEELSAQLLDPFLGPVRPAVAVPAASVASATAGVASDERAA
jgi:sterol desaturase/sphingolipid hydroxylase (fatty acid hydroxylase superfamily)